MEATVKSIEQTKKFTFNDEINQLNPLQCEVTIEVKEDFSNNTNIFNISFKYKYIKGNKQGVSSKIVTPHPFARTSTYFKELADGSIVIKNSMTSEMVKFMLMDDFELAKHCGLSTTQHYRTQIIHTLARLWD